MSNALSALIWWLVPISALIGVFGYILWVTKFQEKFQNETTRSMGQFERFQSLFRVRAEAEAAKAAARDESTPPNL